MTRSLILCLLSFCHPAAAVEKTNVLFIYIEDIGYYTSERAAREPNSRIAGLQTPNLDKLAAGSVNFTHAFCGQSVCSPSKGAILTGLLPHANGIWRNVFNADRTKRNPEKWIPLPSPLTPQNDPSNLGVGGIHEDLPTLIEKLKARGVYCALSGKLHVQPARKFPCDRFFDEGDLDAVIAAAGEKPWLFWCNPGDTHAPWFEVFGGEAENVCHGKSLWPILSGKADVLPGRSTIMTETNNSLMSAPGHRGDGTAARAVCVGRFYYIANLIHQITIAGAVLFVRDGEAPLAPLQHLGFG